MKRSTQGRSSSSSQKNTHTNIIHGVSTGVNYGAPPPPRAAVARWRADYLLAKALSNAAPNFVRRSCGRLAHAALMYVSRDSLKGQRLWSWHPKGVHPRNRRKRQTTCLLLLGVSFLVQDVQILQVLLLSTSPSGSCTCSELMRAVLPFDAALRLAASAEAPEAPVEVPREDAVRIAAIASC